MCQSANWAPWKDCFLSTFHVSRAMRPGAGPMCLGSSVQGWAIGGRGRRRISGGSCGYCEFCRNDDLVNCQKQEYTGIHHDGGYAEVMLAKASGLMRIPEGYCSRSICASAMRGRLAEPLVPCRMRPKSGDIVAVLESMRAGHLGVQYARRMGFEVAGIGPGLR